MSPSYIMSPCFYWYCLWNFSHWMITTWRNDNYQEVVITQWYCSYHPVLSFDVWLHWNGMISYSYVANCIHVPCMHDSLHCYTYSIANYMYKIVFKWMATYTVTRTFPWNKINFFGYVAIKGSLPYTKLA